MCPILASYFDITYFEMVQLIYPSCPGAIEARSQGDGIIVHMLLAQLAELIHPIYLLI